MTHNMFKLQRACDPHKTCSASTATYMQVVNGQSGEITMHQHTYHCTLHDSGTNSSVKNKGVQIPEGFHVIRHGMIK